MSPLAPFPWRHRHLHAVCRHRAGQRALLQQRQPLAMCRGRAGGAKHAFFSPELSLGRGHAPR
eukprot:scaffold1202_cov384-Prasinococcus_capsulatus_cf.AAC.19